MAILTKVQKERQRPASTWIFKTAAGSGIYWVYFWWDEDYTLHVKSDTFIKTYKGVMPYAFKKNFRSVKDNTLQAFFKECYKPCHA